MQCFCAVCNFYRLRSHPLNSGTAPLTQGILSWSVACLVGEAVYTVRP
jgi:hypothetical protein